MKCPNCHSDNPETKSFCGDCGTQLLYSGESQDEATKTIDTQAVGLPRGTLFAGRYEIIEELGRGGMGRVYRAEDTKIKQEIAIKFIRPNISSDKQTIERFSHELKTARMIAHRNVGRMFHLGEEDGIHFITMEYVHGQNLKGLIRQSGQLGIGTTLAIAEQICDGLIEAHKLGIVHRDLKPSNIMIDKEGCARIMDFGIARSVTGKGLTGTDVIIGTPEYMSPEQIEKKDVDQRSDIYSLGVILYEMLTGKRPFEGETPLGIALKHKTEIPIDPKVLNAQIPEELNRIILKCLEKDPAARYQNVTALAVDLKILLGELDTSQLDATLTVPRPPLKTRRISRPLIISLIALVLVLVSVLSISTIREYIIVNLGIRPIPATQYLAVLPFTVSTEDPELGQVSRGLVENLTNKLTQLESLQQSLQVVPYVDARDISNTQEAHKSLGVNLVITGQLVPVLDNVKLMLSLIDTDPSTQLRTRDIEVPRESIFDLNDKAVHAVVEMLALEIKPEMGPILESKGTDNPDAWVYYMEGRSFYLEFERKKEASALDKAIQLFNKAIEKDPSYALAYVDLGGATWKKWTLTKNDVWVDQAKAIFDQAMLINNSLPSLHYALGRMNSARGDYDIAAHSFLQAIQLDPSNYDARQELAYLYEKMGRMVEAEQEYREVIRLKPDYWRGYYYFGLFYCLQGRYEEGEEILLKLKEVAPERAETYDSLGFVYRGLGNIDLAILNYEKLIDIQPSDAAYSNLGFFLFLDNEYKKAHDMFEKALDIRDTDYTVWGNLADTQRLMGKDQEAKKNYEKAVQLAEKVLEVMKKDAVTHSKLARYYALLGDMEKAWLNLSRARELAPNNTEVLMSCVEAYEIGGRSEQALSALAKLIELGGSTLEVERNPDMERLRRNPRYRELIKK